MKIYILTDEDDILQKFRSSPGQIREVIESVAKGTDVKDLIVVIYLLEHSKSWHGELGSIEWLTPEQFVSTRGSWSFAQRFGVPDDLPEKFKLIRLCFGEKIAPYTRRFKDSYGFEFRYATFHDHFAELFAHELHHYRRHHLGLHPREGEISANWWSLEHVKSLGFDVKGSFVDEKKLKRKRRARLAAHKPINLLKDNPKIRTKILQLSSHLSSSDVNYVIDRLQKRCAVLREGEKMAFYERLRSLPPGTPLRICKLRESKYVSHREIVTLKRPLRKDSKRILVINKEGVPIRCPMDWLEIVDDQDEPQT